jgi:hypothetical protein
MHRRNNQFIDDSEWSRLYAVPQQKSKDNIKINREKGCQHVEMDFVG